MIEVITQIVNIIFSLGLCSPIAILVGSIIISLAIKSQNKVVGGDKI